MTEPPAATIEPPEATVVGTAPGGSVFEGTESSTPVPWEKVTATFERRDGTTAIVPANTVGVGCGTGSIEFMNGQTISLEIVQHVRFDTNYIDSGSIDAVVTLLDGRELPDPIRTRNCPIMGTTDLGPLTIPLDDIQHITFDR